MNLWGHTYPVIVFDSSSLGMRAYTTGTGVISKYDIKIESISRTAPVLLHGTRTHIKPYKPIRYTFSICVI